VAGTKARFRSPWPCHYFSHLVFFFLFLVPDSFLRFCEGGFLPSEVLKQSLYCPTSRRMSRMDACCPTLGHFRCFSCEIVRATWSYERVSFFSFSIHPFSNEATHECQGAVVLFLSAGLKYCFFLIFFGPNFSGSVSSTSYYSLFSLP